MKHTAHPGSAIRQMAAFFFATVAVWLLLVGVSRQAPDRGRPQVLQTHDGESKLQSLTFWQQLAISQLPLAPVELPAVVTAAPTPAPSPQTVPEQNEQDSDHQPTTESQTGNIVAQTLVPTSPKGYVTAGGIYLSNRSGREVDLAAIMQNPVHLGLSPAEQGPQILIYHTHTTEAYAMTEEDPYEPTDANSRTLDPEHSVVRVGDEAQQVFEDMGLSVVHHREVYDFPQYDGSYTRSRAAVSQLLAKHPTVKLVLDIHRDALVDETGTIYKGVTTIEGMPTAQIMQVVGSDAAYGNHPGWQANLALATKIQQRLDILYPNLARPVTLRKASYNQELAPGALLVEIGSHGNTLNEALNGVRLYARAAGSVLIEELKAS